MIQILLWLKWCLKGSLEMLEFSGEKLRFHQSSSFGFTQDVNAGFLGQSLHPDVDFSLYLYDAIVHCFLCHICG